VVTNDHFFRGCKLRIFLGKWQGKEGLGERVIRRAEEAENNSNFLIE
jgi:hypothetical protein